ncbi:YihY/virulence factor BrkB family protein [Streptomyces xanthochromogenes]|uniref:YihY/virulence factor BrkB family protein n=1 Tax=Streptomyces xanthochromogenes TaxID=67384 RepID=UPI003F4D997B
MRPLPALLVTALAFGLISPATAEQFISGVTHYAPGQSGPELRGLLAHITEEQSAVWTLMAGSITSAVWSSCSYLAVFRRALHRMHHVPDRRSPWRKAHRIVATALALLVLLGVCALVLILSGPVAKDIGHLLHLDSGVPFVWSLVRWPLLLSLVALLVVVVFHTGPPSAHRRRNSMPGGVLASVLWLTVSAGFALYTTLLGTYSRLYGSLAGIVVFLIWLWLSNLALLTGTQFTAELSKATTTGTHAVRTVPGYGPAAPRGARGSGLGAAAPDDYPGRSDPLGAAGVKRDESRKACTTRRQD